MSTDLSSQESESKKSYRQILREEVQEGRRAMDRPWLGIFLSSAAAGLELGFSLFMMAAVRTRYGGVFDPAVVAGLVANAYTVGFVFVNLGRSELFTEHTALAVLPVLARKASVGGLARLWGIVYAGNLCGAFAFAGLTVLCGPMLGFIEPQALGEIARPVVAHSWKGMLLSAVLAGWLMGLLSWLVTAARDTIGQIVVVWLVTLVIGFAQLHHAVAGSVELAAGIFARQGVTMADYGYFLGWTTLGNALGGVFFVALLKYGHAAQGEEEGREQSGQPARANQERRRQAS